MCARKEAPPGPASDEIEAMVDSLNPAGSQSGLPGEPSVHDAGSPGAGGTGRTGGSHFVIRAPGTCFIRIAMVVQKKNLRWSSTLVNVRW